MKNTKDDHQFAKFLSLKNDVSLGFVCTSNDGMQVMPDRDTTQRVVNTQCTCCGQYVAFDTGWLGWRLWFLPKREFAAPQRQRRLLTLDDGSWNGITEYSPVKEQAQ